MADPRVGVGVIVQEKGRVLVGERKNAHGAGSWATPGGHLEFGETPEECAKRELFEETGLVAEGVRRGPFTSDLINGKHYVTLFVHVTSFSGVVVNKEPQKCSGWEWRAFSDLPDPLFPTIASFFAAYPPHHDYAYLACPYAHPDESVKQRRIEAATEAAYTLFREGISVFSPLTHNAPLVKMGIGNGWEGKWEGFDLGMLGRAHTLYVLTLPGWEKSRGVQAEIAFARKRSIPIEFLT